MFGFGKKIKLVTHDGSFHTDDIFACATLELVLEKTGEKFEVIRTRDEEIINNADYVFDVGGIYDADKNRFDHHQVGGAGKRENGIEYAAFGLVWQKYCKSLCEFQKVHDSIDKRLVTPIDAADNGVDLVVEFKHDIKPYFIQNAFSSFRPTWSNISEENFLKEFLECVKFAKNILSNEIIFAQSIIEAEASILNIYHNSSDKRIIILDKKYPWADQMQNYPEPIFVVFPRVNGSWGVEGVSKTQFSFEKRKNLPSSWGGLREKELSKITGVIDAVFCHKGLFMCVAKSQEGAIKLAQIAVESK